MFFVGLLFFSSAGEDVILAAWNWRPENPMACGGHRLRVTKELVGSIVQADETVCAAIQSKMQKMMITAFSARTIG